MKLVDYLYYLSWAALWAGLALVGAVGLVGIFVYQGQQ